MCPACRGAKICLTFGWPCLWCCGTGRVTPDIAERYANQCEGLARGGFIEGDYNWEQRQAELAEANLVRRTFGLPEHDILAPTAFQLRALTRITA